MCAVFAGIVANPNTPLTCYTAIALDRKAVGTGCLNGCRFPAIRWHGALPDLATRSGQAANAQADNGL